MAVALVASCLSFVAVVYPYRRGPGPGRPRRFTVSSHDDANSVTTHLSDAGYVKGRFAFWAYARWFLADEALVRGEHLLSDAMSPKELLSRLIGRHVRTRLKFMVVPGHTRFDIAKRLEVAGVAPEQGFLSATSDPSLLSEAGLEGDTCEGYLFPATYEFEPDSPPNEVAVRMLSEFKKRYGTALPGRPRGGESSPWLSGTTRELVILASMVEKEAQADEERPVIASVFNNRLFSSAFSPKLLQSDPTALYGCLSIGDKIAPCARSTGRVTHELLTDPTNPFNTYKHEGLPPGPVCNPGAASLDAVTHPAQTDYLYFVARGFGKHTFSTTYALHLKAIQQSTPARP